MVSTRLAQIDREHVAGLHLNMVVVGREAIEAAGPPTPAEQAALERYAEHRRRGTGYSTQQRTRPQTLGYALADSPAGQLAWIVEKFHAWTDHDGHPEDAVRRDRLLDNVMLYWLTNAGASSARMYWESFAQLERGTIEVPTGITMFPKEIFPVSERWARHRFPDLRHYGKPARGGHFAALEQPAVFVDEVRAAFRAMR
jgi:pimeloyl-ACP methyl ester carboxylesterase